MEALPAQCAARSVGVVNGLFATLIQTIIAAQCGVSPPEKWPMDYGPTALENGKVFISISNFWNNFFKPTMKF